jgi:hypothetical protein
VKSAKIIKTWIWKGKGGVEIMKSMSGYALCVHKTTRNKKE